MEKTSQFHFRTSVGGFHKGDVTAYITKTASEHQAAREEMEQRIETLSRENDALRAKIAEISEMAAAPAGPAEPAESAPAHSAPAEQRPDQMELAAYRRAEAAERLALQRSRRLYEALDQICQEASTRFEAANGASQKTVDQILAHMKETAEAYRALSGSLSDARKRLDAMDAMIPDPAEGLEEEA